MSVPTLTIRPGTPAELDVFADFWMAMFEEVGNYREADFRRDWRKRFVGYFEQRIAANEAGFFLAVEGERVAGSAGALIADGYPAVVTGLRRGYIFGVRVAPAFRRRGLAERLTRAASEYLQLRRCEKIRLHASPFGKSIYERLGFLPTNEMELPARSA